MDLLHSKCLESKISDSEWPILEPPPRHTGQICSLLNLSSGIGVARKHLGAHRGLEEREERQGHSLEFRGCSRGTGE